jgi:uncharacterized damage-inducible protein DinB
VTPSDPLQVIVDGWAHHGSLLVDALRGLTSEQLGYRTAPDQWAVWQLAAHVAGARVYWFHDVLGEGDPALRDRFRVTRTTVPDLSLEDAGWEDEEDRPRTDGEVCDALIDTWAMLEEHLRRWTSDDLQVSFVRRGARGDRTFTRAWVVWHLLEHDLHHGGEVSQILGSNGLPGLAL